jgi:glycosyltransferase 2 family protein
MIGSTTVGLALLAYQRPWPWWVATIPVIGGAIILGGVFLGGANRILLLAGRFMPERAGRICELLSVGQPTLSRLAAITAIFLASWVAYLAGWSMLGYVFHSFARIDFISLCAYYTLASVIGIMSVLTPAGLGVRETAFVMMAAGSADRETAAFFAVFGRVWLMVVEITLLLLVAFSFSRKKEKPS